MSSGELIPNDDQPVPASNEVQFALVIARMIDTVKNDPEHMRQAVYELARYQLQEQLTHLDADDVRRTKQQLETAIRGVEEFSRQQFSIPAPAAPPVGDGVSGTHVQDIAAAETRPVERPRRLQLDPAGFLKAGSLWPVSKRTAAVLAGVRCRLCRISTPRPAGVAGLRPIEVHPIELGPAASAAGRGGGAAAPKAKSAAAEGLRHLRHQQRVAG
jgi:hypothetical protein